MADVNAELDSASFVMIFSFVVEIAGTDPVAFSFVVSFVALACFGGLAIVCFVVEVESACNCLRFKRVSKTARDTTTDSSVAIISFVVVIVIVSFVLIRGVMNFSNSARDRAPVAFSKSFKGRLFFFILASATASTQIVSFDF